MVRDAEANSAADKTRRETIETRNKLDAKTYEVEKNAKEWSDKLDAAMKERLEKAVEAGKQALRTGDEAAIKTAYEELNTAYSEAGRSLYAQAQAQQSSAPEGGAEGGEAGQPQPGAADAKKEDVVEADYEIVDENKS